MIRNLQKEINFSLKESNISPISISIIAVFVVLFPLIWRRPFVQNLGILVLMWACLGSAWNIIGGYTGQCSLGHAMFFGIGAYGVVLPFYYWNVTPWIGILIGIAFATLLALLIAIPIFKLNTQYLAIATVALGAAIRIIAINVSFTEGMKGIDFSDFTQNPWYSLQFRNKLPYYYFFAVLLAIVVCTMLYINCSRLGYYFRTIQANQTAAESVGINARKYKTIALIISAIVTAVCGSLYAQYVLYIDPSTVMSDEISIKMIMMAVFGGVGTIQGPIIGALLLVPLSEWTRVKFGSNIPGLDLVLYSFLIIIIIIFQPLGVRHTFHEMRRKIFNLKQHAVNRRI